MSDAHDTLDHDARADHVLRLSYEHGLICGVCGGMAEWLGWKPWAVRVLYVLASILSAAFPGVIVYIALYFAMPGPKHAERATAGGD